MRRLEYIIAIATLVTACGGETEPQLLDPQANADSSNEAGNEATGESEMMFALTAADDGEATTDEELAEASQAATVGQLGSDCVTSVVEGRVVTYSLDECTGPFGFVTMSGDLVSTYSLTTDGVRADIVGSDLAVNNGTASVEATVIRTAEGSTRRLEIDTNWSGTTAKGDKTARVGDYVSTIDPDAGCVTLDGDWSTTIGTAAWDTVVDGFKVCRGECPADGGTIQWIGRNVTTTVTYDGSGTANWENSNGRSGTVQLACGR